MSAHEHVYQGLDAHSVPAAGAGTATRIHLGTDSLTGLGLCRSVVCFVGVLFFGPRSASFVDETVAS